MGAVQSESRLENCHARFVRIVVNHYGSSYGILLHCTLGILIVETQIYVCDIVSLVYRVSVSDIRVLYVDYPAPCGKITTPQS